MKLILFTLLGVGTISFSVSAREDCLAIFTYSAEDVLDMSMGLEERLNRLYGPNFSARPERTLEAEELQLLNSRLEEIISNIDSVRDLEPVIVDILALEAAIDRLERPPNKPVSVVKSLNDSLDLRVLIKTPSELKPDTLYDIHGTDIAVQRVSFSKKILEDVFWDSKEKLVAAHELILKALIKGRANATSSSGVENFVEDRSIFKVKISGHGVGSLRLAGYMEGSDLYLVAYLQSEKHNPHDTQRLFKLVYNAMKTQKH